MFGLIDCNNFYASCERVFSPKYQKWPVVVLSNNDGCVIARSNEAKALGIKMGQPFFEIKALCRQHQIKAFSSNYALYGDMSRRVMSILEALWPEVEIYSIDEAFLQFFGLNQEKIALLGRDLHHKVKQYTGIPVSVGVGPTKTLAKLANHIAKRLLKRPFFDITNAMHWLAEVAVEDVWGIGRRHAAKLHGMGIHTVQDLSQCDALQMRQCFNLMVSRTVLELQGKPCLALEEIAPKKGIMSSRSFGTPQTDYSALAAAISHFCAIASRKLREQHSTAGRLGVFIRTNPFRDDQAQYNVSTSLNLIYPSNDVRLITKFAKHCLTKLYKPGYLYKKVGVYLDDFTPEQSVQLDLFAERDEKASARSVKLMTVLDAINQRYGRSTLVTAAEGVASGWGMKQCLRSPNYTTCWSDLLEVGLG